MSPKSVVRPDLGQALARIALRGRTYSSLNAIQAWSSWQSWSVRLLKSRVEPLIRSALGARFG
jgi:hypothetical protein